MRHSSEGALCHITSPWERFKQGAYRRRGSEGVLTWAKKDRDEQPGGKDSSSKPQGEGWSVKGSDWLAVYYMGKTFSHWEVASFCKPTVFFTLVLQNITNREHPVNQRLNIVK